MVMPMPDIGAAMSGLDVWNSERTSDDYDFELEHITQPIPIPIGIPELDRVLGGGIPVGMFTVVGGEAGAGKSALACIACYCAARSGRFPVFFSMEMPKQMVVNRMLSIHSSIKFSKGEWPQDRIVWWSQTGREVTRRMGGIGQRADMLKLDSTERYKAAQNYLSKHKDDDIVLSCWNDFKAELWPRMIIRDDIHSICGNDGAISVIERLCDAGLRPFPIIDYLQLGADGDGDEYERVTRASHSLARLCKQKTLAMLVLSGLRNISQNERNEKPRLSWFRGSGHTGYDAGTAVILTRDKDQQGGNVKITANIIKNRVGDTDCDVSLRFNGARNLIGV